MAKLGHLKLKGQVLYGKSIMLIKMEYQLFVLVTTKSSSVQAGSMVNAECGKSDQES